MTHPSEEAIEAGARALHEAGFAAHEGIAVRWASVTEGRRSFLRKAASECIAAGILASIQKTIEEDPDVHLDSRVKDVTDKVSFAIWDVGDAIRRFGIWLARRLEND